MIAQLELIKKEIQTPVLRDYQIQFIKVDEH
jgi:hypothetical protein